MQGRPEGVLGVHAPDHSHLPCLDEVGALCISALLHHHCVVRQALQLYHPCQVMQLPCCPAPVHISAPCCCMSFLTHHAFLASCTFSYNSALHHSVLHQVHAIGQLLATATWLLANSHGICSCYCVHVAKQHAQEPLASAVKVVTIMTAATIATVIAASYHVSRTTNCIECCCDQHHCYSNDCCKA